MEQKTQSLKFKRQRKFFMIMPVMVLPFITLLFWALGGGKAQDNALEDRNYTGLNMSLPDPHLGDDQPLDKLSYYQKASSDSAKLKQLIKNDPYYQLDHLIPSDNKPSALEVNFKKKGPGRTNISSLNNEIVQDSNEVKIYRKLRQLNETLDHAATSDISTQKTDISTDVQKSPVESEDIDRLEKMLSAISQPADEDQETKDLNNMLEKILDIQHPERVRKKIKQFENENRKQAFTLTSTPVNDQVELTHKLLLDSVYQLQMIEESNGFYSLNNEEEFLEAQNAIQAVVHETQTLVNGSTVKLRLLNDTYINQVLIPKDNFVYGIASLKGERLTITINSIRYQNSIIPVDLSVYDLDGLSGIYIPGAIARDVAKESADNALQGVSLNTYDTSLGIQAASVGIEAAKSLFSKKVKLIKVTVKAGYQILLQNEKQQQNF